MSNFLYAQPDNAEFQVTSSAPMLSFSELGEHRNHSSEVDKSRESYLEHHRLLLRNHLIWHRVKAILKALILLFLSTGYLAFCYTVNRRIVTLKSLGPYSITPNHFETVKSAITTLNIALVTLALYPISDILSELKSEEFFRALIQKGTRGVPLSTINAISSPVFGIIDSIHAIITRRCSRFFVVASVGSLIAFVTSVLAPTALSIQSVLADGDIVAISVGAVANNSVFNGSDVITEMNAESNADFAASILWAETILGLQYDFSAAASLEADVSAFIVPQPLDLPMTSTARWLTDVIGLSPSCTWASTNITQPIIVLDASDSFSPVAGVYLEGLDLDVGISPNAVSGSSLANVAAQDPTLTVFNHTTLMRPTDGSTVFLAGQCTEGCSTYSSSNYVWLNFTGIPTFSLQLPPTMVFGTESWQLAFLVCKPNAVIETREVRAEGSAMLFVQPPSDGKQLTRQGNLFSLDTTTMLSIALGHMLEAGPSNNSAMLGLGSEPQVKFLFGSKQVDSWPGGYSESGSDIVNASFLSIANLSTNFGQMLQSASKGCTCQDTSGLPTFRPEFQLLK
ncbi:hypothetical protein DEU56DRAFT_302261 [Suillus clintonianus]|uniref:uncharacterized protein n=1 Tax=Suillus clintonianus TaxID=1904413 RepID=UPI001B85F537|nr:uncharacterized protein DEU56DRAFT_302261 [Suillus clintonianus]KAG2139732.1 hypothetical protein DEU56DRAFT_302261 [Suillus clintonianus]